MGTRQAGNPADAPPHPRDNGALSIAGMLGHREAATTAFFSAEAQRIANLSLALVNRFADGGRLYAVGAAPSARSGARHVACDFIHPEVADARSLPAIGLA